MLLKTLTLRNYRKYKDVDVELPDGVIGIIGLNGVGKTTLIEAIGGGLVRASRREDDKRTHKKGRCLG